MAAYSLLRQHGLKNIRNDHGQTRLLSTRFGRTLEESPIANQLALKVPE